MLFRSVEEKEQNCDIGILYAYQFLLMLKATGHLLKRITFITVSSASRNI